MDETPHSLDDIAELAYEIAHKSNPSALQSIRTEEVFEKQRELIIVAETVLLTTINFDFDIQLPHKTLVAILKRSNIPNCAEFSELASYLVDQWLQASLFLQYKPHYIAAGSINLAARILKVELPTENGRVWWSDIVEPEQLDEVTKLMHSKLGPLPPNDTAIVHSVS